MEIVKSLKGISFDLIYEAFGQAFKDYEVQVNQEELRKMLRRRGFVPELSFAAFHGDRIVSFTFNGIGVYQGRKTAYDTGSGTLKEYRGQGLATRIFQHSVPFLKEAGVEQYLLEVLQHNENAVSVYQKVGFQVSREFNYYVLKQEELQMSAKDMQGVYQIQPIDRAQREAMSQFCDFDPSWQNSFDAINRQPEDFTIQGAFKEKELLGYCVFEPSSGDITQIAVHPNYRRKGIGTRLIREVVKLNQNDSLKIINTEVGCESMAKFWEAHSIQPSGKQFEMILPL
ncbi:MAG: GNAT family N-acetyltransferase [Marinifilaceae bacterium]